MLGTTPPHNDNPVEAHYRQQFLALFARVQAKYPERGIAALFKRAAQQVVRTGCSQKAALEAEYQAAKIRTEKRLTLTKQCGVNPVDDTR